MQDIGYIVTGAQRIGGLAWQTRNDPLAGLLPGITSQFRITMEGGSLVVNKFVIKSKLYVMGGNLTSMGSN